MAQTNQEAVVEQTEALSIEEQPLRGFDLTGGSDEPISTSDLTQESTEEQNWSSDLALLSSSGGLDEWKSFAATRELALNATTEQLPKLTLSNFSPEGDKGITKAAVQPITRTADPELEGGQVTPGMPPRITEPLPESPPGISITLPIKDSPGFTVKDPTDSTTSPETPIVDKGRSPNPELEADKPNAVPDQPPKITDLFKPNPPGIIRVIDSPGDKSSPRHGADGSVGPRPGTDRFVGPRPDGFTTPRPGSESASGSWSATSGKGDAQTANSGAAAFAKHLEDMKLATARLAQEERNAAKLAEKDAAVAAENLRKLLQRAVQNGVRLSGRKEGTVGSKLIESALLQQGDGVQSKREEPVLTKRDELDAPKEEDGALPRKSEIILGLATETESIPLKKGQGILPRSGEAAVAILTEDAPIKKVQGALPHSEESVLHAGNETEPQGSEIVAQVKKVRGVAAQIIAQAHNERVPYQVAASLPLDASRMHRAKLVEPTSETKSIQRVAATDAASAVEPQVVRQTKLQEHFGKPKIGGESQSLVVAQDEASAKPKQLAAVAAASEGARVLNTLRPAHATGARLQYSKLIASSASGSDREVQAAALANQPIKDIAVSLPQAIGMETVGRDKHPTLLPPLQIYKQLSFARTLGTTAERIETLGTVTGTASETIRPKAKNFVAVSGTEVSASTILAKDSVKLPAAKQSNAITAVEQSIPLTVVKANVISTGTGLNETFASTDSASPIRAKLRVTPAQEPTIAAPIITPVVAKSAGETSIVQTYEKPTIARSIIESSIVLPSAKPETVQEASTDEDGEVQTHKRIERTAKLVALARPARAVGESGGIFTITKQAIVTSAETSIDLPNTAAGKTSDRKFNEAFDKQSTEEDTEPVMDESARVDKVCKLAADCKLSVTYLHIGNKLLILQRRFEAKNNSEDAPPLACELAVSGGTAALLLSMKRRRQRRRISSQIQESSNDDPPSPEEQAKISIEDALLNPNGVPIAAPLSRFSYMIQPGDTLAGIAISIWQDADLAWLIAEINKLKPEWQGHECKVTVSERQIIGLPLADEVVDFYRSGRYSQHKNYKLTTIVVSGAIDSELLSLQSRGQNNECTTALHLQTL